MDGAAPASPPTSDDAPPPTPDPYATRILDATYALVARHGLPRTSIADVVRESGVSKATLFRRFPSRAALLNALMAREIDRFLASLDARLRPIEEPLDRLVEVFLHFVEVVRDHEILRNLVETDPETVLPLLTTQAEPLLALGRTFMAAELTRVQEAGHELTADPEVCVELLTRLAHSYLVLPGTAIPLDDADAVRALGRDTLVRLVVRT